MKTLLVIYFLINAYWTGAAFVNASIRRDWISFLAFCLLGGPIVLVMWSWDKIRASTWFHNIKFWWYLNISGKYAQMNRKDRRQAEKLAESPKAHPRVKRQWARIKFKYGY